jgi:antitoxin component YwqK of YwqJK toxin-antitoxin module
MDLMKVLREWTVKKKCTYKKGEPNGPYESYYENGQLNLKSYL